MRPSDGLAGSSSARFNSKLLHHRLDFRRHLSAQDRIHFFVNPFRARPGCNSFAAAAARLRRFGGVARARIRVHANQVRLAAGLAAADDFRAQAVAQADRAEFGRARQIICNDANHFADLHFRFLPPTAAKIRRRRHANGRKQTCRIRLALPRDVERRAVIHRRADNRQTERDVHAGVERQHLERNVSLVVIKRDDGVEFFALPGRERRVRHQRAFNLNSAFARLLHCRARRNFPPRGFRKARARPRADSNRRRRDAVRAAKFAASFPP